MNGYFTKDRVEFFQFQTLRRVFLVLGRDVARRSRHTAGFVLRALHDYLNSITFLCHLSINWGANVTKTLYSMQGAKYFNDKIFRPRRF